MYPTIYLMTTNTNKEESESEDGDDEEDSSSSSSEEPEDHQRENKKQKTLMMKKKMHDEFHNKDNFLWNNQLEPTTMNRNKKRKFHWEVSDTIKKYRRKRVELYSH